MDLIERLRELGAVGGRPMGTAEQAKDLGVDLVDIESVSDRE